jgi:hypothetical protein
MIRPLSLLLYMMCVTQGLAPLSATQPKTAICGRAVPVDYIIGYPDPAPKARKSRWGIKERAVLADSFTKSLAQLCAEKLIKPRVFADKKQIIFIENDNANVISLMSFGRAETSPGDEPTEEMWRSDALYVEVPLFRRMTQRTLSPEMRRAALCAYNMDVALAKDPVACLVD